MSIMLLPAYLREGLPYTSHARRKAVASVTARRWTQLRLTSSSSILSQPLLLSKQTPYKPSASQRHPLGRISIQALPQRSQVQTLYKIAVLRRPHEQKVGESHTVTRRTFTTTSKLNEAARNNSDTDAQDARKEAKGQADGDRAEQDEQKKEKKSESPPPPPPHGDKTPWQVFTETLSTEFKASKEWNESTKALASSAHDFTQNETVKRARSAYSQVSDTATSKTSAALKTTGKAIGHGAAWAWSTPVAQGVRKSASAMGSGIEKATRPVRETEAYKNVKDVIDDGSSSRYGGWTEKEERRKRREKRIMNESTKHGGTATSENTEEDPK